MREKKPMVRWLPTNDGRIAMNDIHAKFVQLVEQGRDLHRRERAISLESVRLIGMLDRGNAAVNLGVSIDTLARQLGLTPSMFCKRAQAARVIHFYPEAAEMVEKGETEISHLAALAARITPANAQILLSGIKNKSKREVEQLLSIVTPDGRILEKEPEVEIRATLTQSQLAMLDRAREVLSHGGKVPSNAEVLVKALGDLLEQRDPLRKAERAAKRAAKRAGELDGAPSDEQASEAEKEAAETRPTRAPGHERSAIPAAVRHAVELRDQGQCRRVLADGSRCPERHNVELDHIVPVCRGGKNAVENLVLACRRHNRSRAEHQLGEKYLVSWQESRERPAKRSPRP